MARDGRREGSSLREPLACLVLAALPAAGPAPAAPDGDLPWDGPAFAAEPGAILEAAASIPVREGVAGEIFLEEGIFVLDEQGRRTTTHRIVYRITGPAGVQFLSSVSSAWARWHQKRPSIRARVVTPDGRAHDLDPATLDESPAREAGPDSFEDLRMIRAPLPALTVGSVVEEEITIEETAPFFDAGVVSRFEFGGALPTRRTRVVVDAPSSLPVRHVVRRLPEVVPKETRREGRTRWTFEAGPIEPIERIDMLAPGDAAIRPYVAFSTARSWPEVARRYGEIVDAQILSGPGRMDLPAAAAGRHPGAVAADLLGRLRSQIRYTRLQFGEAGIVPAAPGETLRRKFGDCKDQATLLVAMLREAGVPASVALLRTGPGPDVDEELPGLGAFDHSIVHVPGPPAIWIDPSDRFSRAGDLPIQDQGRLALVAGPASPALVRTPGAAASDNRAVETREYLLAETGPGRVVETTEAWGSLERRYREAYYGADPAKVREQLDAYVRSAYGAARLEEHELSDPEDLSAPFRIRLVAAGAAVATTGDVDAAVAIPTTSLAGTLAPYLALLGGDVEAGRAAPEGSPADAPKGAPRTADVEWPEPYVMEVRIRIVPPPGYGPRPPPPETTTAYGPATLYSRFEADDAGVVTGTIRFEASRNRLSPKELGELAAGVERLREADPLMVAFEQGGEAHLLAGRVREALETFRDLAALHPGEALHRTQISRAFLGAGLGEAAREEAGAALKLEPSSALAHRNLGWILEHDLVGRRFRRGADLRQAEAAYRKARSLDPNDPVARASLAILLEHDDEGERYGPTSRLSEAVEEYRALKADLGNGSMELNLLAALVRAGRFEEAEEAARRTPGSAERDALRVAAAAGRGGAGAVAAAASSIADLEQRRAALLAAGWILVTLRRYETAADLLAAGSKGGSAGAPLPTQVDMIRRTRRHEEITFPDGDPRGLIQRFLTVSLKSDRAEKALPSIFSRRLLASSEEDDVTRGFRIGARRSLAAMDSAGMPRDVALDLALSNMEMRVEGDAAGYKVSVSAPGVRPGALTAAYLAPEEGELRVVALTGLLGDMGHPALERIEHEDRAGARRWLDWAAEEYERLGGSGAPTALAFPAFWKKGTEPGRDAFRHAAACLLAEGPGAGRAVTILTQGREAAATEAERIGFDLALARAFVQLRRHRDLLEAAGRLAGVEPEMEIAFDLLTLAHVGLEDWDGLRRAAEARLERRPDDPQALRALESLAANRGDFDEAVRLGRRLVATGRAGPADHNNLAWTALFRPPVSDEDLDAARKAVVLTGHADSASLHTLAALYAEAGRLDDAREVLLRSMEMSGHDEPRADDWYVVGRIAEQLGEREAAVRAYEKVTPEEGPMKKANSTYALARLRLEGLAPAPPPGGRP
jgi:tetratricopeptide (TPR) repeat protein